jgi:methylenetetrahydrofolate reductase (NADPH)
MVNLQFDIKITDILQSCPFTVSAEVIPPRNGVGPAKILNQIEGLTQAGAQYLAVTKGAGGSLRGGSLPIAQMIKDRFQKPCIAHFTCRDLLPEEVENHLVDHHFFGIRNILALRGDPPQGVSEWEPREGSHNYAYQLVEQIKALNEGLYLERENFQAVAREKTDFCIGVACYPDHSHANERIEFFKRKAEAGAEYAISQMLFDSDSYARFLDDCANAGVFLPVLPGTRLLKSRTQAARVAKRFQVSIPEAYLKGLPETDAEATSERSLDCFLRFANELKSKGAPGIHVFVLSDTELAKTAIQTILTKF